MRNVGPDRGVTLAGHGIGLGSGILAQTSGPPRHKHYQVRARNPRTPRNVPQLAPTGATPTCSVSTAARCKSGHVTGGKQSRHRGRGHGQGRRSW
eukprot:3073696-Rhodomonas_salina.1